MTHEEFLAELEGLPEAEQPVRQPLAPTQAKVAHAPSSRPRGVNHRDLMALAEALRVQLHTERAARRELEREVTALRSVVDALRAELGVERHVRELVERMDRLEARGVPPLRAIVG